MTYRKVLITGGSGLLALNWACAIRATHEVVLATHTRRVSLEDVSAAPLALEDTDVLSRELERIAPDVIVHTAGITSVEQCAREPELARHVYVDLSRNMARAAQRVGAGLIHISTDHLFAGTRALYREDDAAEPVNAYARVKLAAEEAVREEYPRALVVRTNFFGWGHRYRQSFSDWIYYSLREGKSLTMFEDVFITPILADGLAASAQRLLELGASGIYNVAGDERISKYDFGVRLASTFGLPERLVRRGTIAASQTSVKRPPDMSLDSAKARALLGGPFGTVADFLSTLERQDREGRRRELLAAVTE
jgi:dTDP-4-dehydrorhamnose reductase